MAIGIMRMLKARKQKETSPTSSPSRYMRLSSEESESDGGSRKGYIPVIVGAEEGTRERFFIPTQFLSHPVIVSMLESSADEFGYRQEGVLQIPTDPDYFREIIKSLH